MTSPEMKKASAATEAIKKSEPNPYEGEQTMSTVPQTADKFSNEFSIATTHARVYIEPDDDYCEKYGIKPEQRALDTAGMLRLDTGEDVVFLSPAEALSVAAALQAVSVHLLEQQPREIRRSTEPGAPSFEEAI